MLHTYVLNALSKPISLERAERLMDSAVVRETLDNGYSPEKSPQGFFDVYCYLHEKVHGRPFPPDVAESF